MKGSEFRIVLKKSSAGFAAAALLLSGCGGDKAPAVSGPKKAAAKSTVSAAAGTQAPADKIPQSVFTVDDSLRDPFFPNAKKTAPQGTAENPVMDIPALLQAELVGIGGAGSERMAVFRSALLEPGKTATISVNAGGQARGIQVRCREISRNTVTLDAQGYPRPIVITVPQAR